MASVVLTKKASFYYYSFFYFDTTFQFSGSLRVFATCVVFLRVHWKSRGVPLNALANNGHEGMGGLYAIKVLCMVSLYTYILYTYLAFGPYMLCNVCCCYFSRFMWLKKSSKVCTSAKKWHLCRPKTRWKQQQPRPLRPRRTSTSGGGEEEVAAAKAAEGGTTRCLRGRKMPPQGPPQWA